MQKNGPKRRVAQPLAPRREGFFLKWSTSQLVRQLRLSEVTAVRFGSICSMILMLVRSADQRVLRRLDRPSACYPMVVPMIDPLIPAVLCLMKCVIRGWEVVVTKIPMVCGTLNRLSNVIAQVVREP